MAGLDSSPRTTLLILLGASSWPHAELGGSIAFEKAARDLQAYFLSDPNGFRLPKDNILNLFNSELSNSDILNRIGSFLEERTKAIPDIRDVFVYYVGHGGITSSSSAFYLAIRNTHKEYEKATSIEIEDLAERLKKGAMFKRRILILDCCFAARALPFLQGSAPAELASRKTIAAFEEKDHGEGVPSKGTSFLASSGKDVASIVLPDKTSTAFTSSLLSVLRTGDPFQERERLTLHTVHRLTRDFLIKTYGDKFPQPEIHSPDQSEGNIATTIAYFPNPRAAEVRARRVEEERIRKAEEERLRKAREEQARQAEEREKRHQAEEAEQTRRMEERQARQAEEVKRQQAEEQARRIEEERVRKAKETTLVPTKMARASTPPALRPDALIPTKPTKRGISRSHVLVGLAGLIVVALVSGITWLTLRHSFITEFPVPTANSGLGEITAGPDGNLWFTEAYRDKIGRISPSGTITEFPIPTTNSAPNGIAAGPDGNLWFTEFNGNKIGRISPSGTITEFSIPTTNSAPNGITAGPDGNLWFTEDGNNTIGHISLGGK